jgi:hypothetical protein
MAVEDTRSYLNPLKPSWSEVSQREKLTGEIYCADQREALLRSLRKGSVVEVVETFLLAKTVGRVDVRKRDLLAIVDQIENRKGVIRELATGHQSNIPKQWRQMQARAFALISSSARGKNSAVNGKQSKGRPHKTYHEDQLSVMEKVWFSRRYKTIAERMSYLGGIGIKVKRGWMYSRFGTVENPRVKL